jgi:hypothetical protein
MYRKHPPLALNLSKWIQSLSYPVTFLRSILVVCFHPRLDISSVVLFVDLPTKFL